MDNLTEKEVVLVRNQTELVYQYLLQGHTLTTLDAMLKLGVGRLANHICELRKKGKPIQSKRINQTNGKGKHYYLYWLDANYINNAKTA